MGNKTVFEDTFSEEVWATTYKNHQDQNIDESFKRVAKSAAKVEKTDELKAEWEKKFYAMLSGFSVVPAGRILTNAGTEWEQTTLLNCFVSPREPYDTDSIEGILNTLKNQCQTLKSEGGWGENFSYIRPRGTFIHGVGVETPGAIKYMELFDKASDVITSGSGKKSTNKKAKQKIRKGAMMGVLDVTHPDIVEFITAKQNQGRLSKFNISVNCTDEFMQKVLHVEKLKEIGASESEIEAEDEWHLRFPETTSEKYKDEWDGNLKNWEEKGYPTNIHNTISVTWLWDLIMKSTYNRAEPGVLFLDRANYFNPLKYKETIQATNPCGEQVLAPSGVCDLGSVNLTQYVLKDPSDFDYIRIKRDVRSLVRFLDNINDIANPPLPEYRNSVQKKRRIGCGVMGWGSALFMMKIAFGSKKAEEIKQRLMEVLSQTAYETSIDLAVEKGMFEYCEPEKHAESPFIQNLGLSKTYMRKLQTTGIRNSSLLSIQPTGNTSILANVVSGGIEPIFMPEYIRTVIVNVVPDDIRDVTPKWFEGEWCETEMFKFAKEGDEDILKGTAKNGTVYKIDKNRGLTKEVLCEDYGVRYLKDLGEWNPKAAWAKTTTELSAKTHVDDLKGFAKYIDSAISKTINVPHDYSFDDFQDLYIDAYQSGYIKGLTTYRAGTMTTVLSAKEESADNASEEIILDDVKLPDTAKAVMKTIKAEGKKWYLSIVFLDESHTKPFALFVKTNVKEPSVSTHDGVDRLLELAKKKGILDKHIEDVKSKFTQDNNADKVARSISMLLRHGVFIKNIVATLDNMENVFVGSFLFQIKKFLSTYIKDGEVVEDEKCVECGMSSVIFREGCKVCSNCGSSKCG